ncbi:hypothetical protein GCM10010121_029950 [Streptomyces brasiliensis]|uniref:Secreted protein n=1 Tax=Streptomyces brasiliensis TaxID=1954 RepID=A0A917KJT3_9ACTN|nr:hypothetical protein GCM10010121_029950 [Streptomyces brasiliensis]
MAATVTAAMAATVTATVTAAMAATVTAAMAATVTAAMAATVTATVTAAMAATVVETTVTAVVVGVVGRRSGARCPYRDATGHHQPGGRHREKAPGALCSHERYLSFHRLSRPWGGVREWMAAAAWSKRCGSV